MPTTQKVDLELNTLGSIAEQLEPLTPGGRARVLIYLMLMYATSLELTDDMVTQAKDP